MKYGRVIKLTLEILFFKNYGENEAGRLVPDLILFFKKVLHGVKAVCLQLCINIAR